MHENWYVRETEFQRSGVRQQESVFTIGNGYLSTRGTFEEGFLGDLPATLVHGVFDDAPIVGTELANAPDWLNYRLKILVISLVHLGDDLQGHAGLAGNGNRLLHALFRRDTPEK